MTWALYLLASLLVLALIALAWSHIALRRRIDRYARAVRKIAYEEGPVSALPEDERGLEALAYAVKTLALSQHLMAIHLESERARLAAVLDRMSDGVLIADPEGRILLANPAAESLFDLPDAPGHSVVEVLRQHQLVEAWQRSQASGKPQEESVELPGRHQFVQLVVLPDLESGASLLLAQNLTRVRRLETIRRDFVSNVSHELRTPLASLKALTETLRDGALEDPPAARRFLGRIETEVDALTQMTQELLELTRIESGQVPLEFKLVQPGGLLASAGERMRAQAERAGLAIRLEVPGDLPPIKADATRLEQVLVNLIHNAIKFTRPGGEVVLSAAAEGDFVRFAVQDTGVGIPADDLERIFERFYKADRARTGGGTGLGLSIARHLVEAHGGRIWAESVEGQGSTIFFTIPISR